MRHSLRVLIRLKKLPRYKYLFLVSTQAKLGLAQCCEILCAYDLPVLVVRHSVSKVT